MAKQSQPTISIPASLVPQFEAWGRLTARLFSQLRTQARFGSQNVGDDQTWYWTEQWQLWEQQADNDIAFGRVKKFSTVAELLADLEA